jgi:hypothetical protein
LGLRPEAGSPEELAVATLPASAITAPNYYRFTFPPQRESRQRYYALQLELDGAGEVGVGQGAADSYLDGALYQNGQPIEAQMMFRLVYDTPPAMLGLGQMALEWVAMTVAGLALFVLPGWVALSRWWPDATSLAWPEKFGLAAGLSVALYPVMMLWTHLIGLQLGAWYAWLPAVLGTTAVIWQARHIRLGALTDKLARWRHSGAVWADVTLVFVVLLTFASRYWLIRSQEAPMWGDSVHHTMIAQLMLDNGGLFNSWLPYAELGTFTYHFGFHSAVAVFAWLTGLDALRAVLWTGQILNGLAVLALWPLVARLSGNRWAAVAVVVVAGLLSPMPNYYVNWGRYTQLAGQVILPGAVAVVWWIVERRGAIPGVVWALGIAAWGGLALTHYRMLMIGVIFVAMLAAVEALSGHWRAALLLPTLLGLGAVGLFVPWFVRVFGGRIMDYFAVRMTTPPAALSDFDRQYNSLGDVTFYLPVYLLGLALVALAVTLVRRHRAGGMIAGWGALALLAANPQWLGLPGSGVISSPAVMMGAYVFVAVLIGGACGWGFDDLGAWSQRSGVQLAWVGVFTIVAVLGLRQRFGDYRPDLHAMVTRPDMRAITWIQANLAPEARLLVEDFFAYGGGLVVGADAGWWLPLLAERMTTLPPMLYGSEQGSERSGHIQFVNTRAAIIDHLSLAAPETLQLLRAQGITHVYVAQRQGQVGNPNQPLLSSAILRTSPAYRLIYQQDRVSIFALNP